SRAPARSRARAIFSSACTVCRYGSFTPTIVPSAPVAVVPETCTASPTRTAREYPIIGSHFEPVEIFSRFMQWFLQTVAIDEQLYAGRPICTPLNAVALGPQSMRHFVV